MKTLLILTALFITSCASFDPPTHCVDRGDGLCWWKADTQMPAQTYEWVHVDAMRASIDCKYSQTFDNASCFYRQWQGKVVIVSALSEAAAKKIESNHSLGQGESIFCHEVDSHGGLNLCGKNPFHIQWVHSGGPAYSITHSWGQR